VGIPNGRPQKVLRIDATGAPSSLIGRLLVGSYITGQDQVLVTARGGLGVGQRAEIRRVVDRLLGMTVVNDTPAVVEIQNFIDPGKYELPRLLHRAVEMLRHELEICEDALDGNDPFPLERIESLEEEVDRDYLLMARQLLLSSDSPRLAREINVESHHFQIGDRLVAKVLEVTGDLIHGIGSELGRNLDGLRRMPGRLARDLGLRIRHLKSTLTRTMVAFAALSVVDANENLDQIAETLPRHASFGLSIPRRVPDQGVAAAAQRIVCNLTMALEMLVIVNEVTINRSVEPETVALTGTRVVMEARRSPLPRACPAA
jgi:phosphate uptake regulator